MNRLAIIKMKNIIISNHNWTIQGILFFFLSLKNFYLGYSKRDDYANDARVNENFVIAYEK